MAGGDNHAKMIVIEEAEDLAAKLQNGSSGDKELQGRAIALIVKMITPLYSAQFMTAQECRVFRRGTRQKNRANNSRVKIGPIELEGPILSTILLNIIPITCSCVMVYTVGKMQNWW